MAILDIYTASNQAGIVLSINDKGFLKLFKEFLPILNSYSNNIQIPEDITASQVVIRKTLVSLMPLKIDQFKFSFPEDTSVFIVGIHNLVQKSFSELDINFFYSNFRKNVNFSFLIPYIEFWVNFDVDTEQGTPLIKIEVNVIDIDYNSVKFEVENASPLEMQIISSYINFQKSIIINTSNLVLNRIDGIAKKFLEEKLKKEFTSSYPVGEKDVVLSTRLVERPRCIGTQMIFTIEGIFRKIPDLKTPLPLLKPQSSMENHKMLMLFVSESSVASAFSAFSPYLYQGTHFRRPLSANLSAQNSQLNVTDFGLHLNNATIEANTTFLWFSLQLQAKFSTTFDIGMKENDGQSLIIQIKEIVFNEFTITSDTPYIKKLSTLTQVIAGFFLSRIWSGKVQVPLSISYAGLQDIELDLLKSQINIFSNLSGE